MPRLYKTATVLAVGLLLLGCFAFGPTADAEGTDEEARKEKIVANLKLHFPPLQQAQVTMNDIEATQWEGLDKGSLTLRNPQGQTQTLAFLVSDDDTELFLLNNPEPLDVSKSQNEIQAELDAEEAKKAEEAEARRAAIEQRIEDEPVRGNPDAPVTIVEFSDFQCPYCARGADTVEALLEKYPNDVKFVFQHYPLNFHPWARPSAIAAECVANQDDDLFWELHDFYFEKQKEITPDNVMDETRSFLEGKDVDIAAFVACAEDTDSPEYKAAAQEVDQEMNWGQSMGVTGTPGFFVNGVALSGAQPPAAFEPMIQAAKAAAADAGTE